MRAATDTELGGAKKTASVTAEAKPKRAAARKSAAETQDAAATKAGMTENQMVPEGDGMSQESVESEVVATVNDETNAAEHDGSDNSTQKRGGAKKTSGTAVKALTEAGKKRLVNKLLGLAEAQATLGSFKITPADLIRLMQLHKEMTPQRERKVTVQWIEDRAE